MSLRWGRIVLRMAIPGNKDAEVIGAGDCSAAAVECQTYFFCIAPLFLLDFLSHSLMLASLRVRRTKRCMMF
jgi:hypothetical protein